jgi:putative membrane protein
MQRFVLRLVITALAVLLASYLFTDQIAATDLSAALLFALVLGVLTLPLTLLTLGLFTLVVNAIVFWVATLFPVGVRVSGFAGAFLGALVVSIVSFFASRIIR